MNKQDESWRPLAELLLEFGAKVNPLPYHEDGEPPLVSLLDVSFQTRQKWDFLLRHGVDPLMRASSRRIGNQLLLERAFEKKNSEALAAMLDFLPIDTRFPIYSYFYSYSYSQQPRPERSPWQLAIENRNIAAIKQLAKRGANLEERDFWGHTALYKAVGRRDELMQVLLDAGARPDEEILKHAIDQSTREDVAYKIDARSPAPFLAPLVARVRAAPHSPWTYSPLLRALLTGNSGVVQLLLDAQPPTDDRERFFLAASQGNGETLRKLAQKTPTLISSPLPKGETPMHLAALWGHAEIVRFLSSRGANVNAHAPNGRVPLHYALDNPDTKRVRATVAVLLAAGANPNELGRHSAYHSEPVFESAINYGDADVVRQFLDNGAKGRMAFIWSQTPLGMAVRQASGQHLTPTQRDAKIEVVRLFLQRSGDREWLKFPLLQEALSSDFPDFKLSRLLLSYGADINSSSGAEDEFIKGTTPISVVLSHPKSLRFVLEHGANPDVLDSSNEGLSLVSSLCLSFYFATEPSHGTYGAPVPHKPSPATLLESARILLETKRVPLNAGPGYRSPLEFALDAQSSEMVALLLEFGADPNEKNKQGKTPLDIARETGKYEATELMEKALASKAVVH